MLFRSGVPVLKINAPRRIGLNKLLFKIPQLTLTEKIIRKWKMPECIEATTVEIQNLLQQEFQYETPKAFFESLRLLAVDDFHSNGFGTLNEETKRKIETCFQNIEEQGIDRRAIAIESRYSWIQSICNEVLQIETISQSTSDKLDKIFTHKIDRKSTRLNSSHVSESRMPSSA